jgi:hypothetical protein
MDDSTLACQLRSLWATSHCPSSPAGQDTTPSQTVTEEFTVDQSGLTILDGANHFWLVGPIALSHVAPTTPISTTGEKIF